MNEIVSTTIVQNVRPELIEFHHQLLSSSQQQPGAYPIRNWDVLNGAMLVVHSLTAGTSHFDGSAVMVAPGIALMATHVVDEIYARSPTPKAITLWGITQGQGLVVWECRRLTRIANCDITVAVVELASPLPKPEVHLAAMTLRPPRVGERVIVLGFRAETVESHDQGAVVRGDAHVSVGSVTGLHLAGRDRVMVPWPAIEVNTTAKGGLSGGPVFNESGRLIGVLGTSFETADGSGPLYVSALYPALTLPVTPLWPPGIYSGPVILKDVDPRLCEIEGREYLRPLGRSDFAYDFEAAPQA